MIFRLRQVFHVAKLGQQFFDLTLILPRLGDHEISHQLPHRPQASASVTPTVGRNGVRQYFDQHIDNDLSGLLRACVGRVASYRFRPLIEQIVDVIQTSDGVLQALGSADVNDVVFNLERHSLR